MAHCRGTQSRFACRAGGAPCGAGTARGGARAPLEQSGRFARSLAQPRAAGAKGAVQRLARGRVADFRDRRPAGLAARGGTGRYRGSRGDDRARARRPARGRGAELRAGARAAASRRRRARHRGDRRAGRGHGAQATRGGRGEPPRRQPRPRRGRPRAQSARAARRAAHARARAARQPAAATRGGAARGGGRAGAQTRLRPRCSTRLPAGRRRSPSPGAKRRRGAASPWSARGAIPM